jgi:hypothetical protein
MGVEHANCVEPEKRRRASDELLLRKYRWALEFPGDAPGKTKSSETMAQVCWWRLMAEEVRVEADGFRSSSAKATMRIVAQTWDRMAEDLERRLTRRR